MIETDEYVVLCYDELVILDTYGFASILKKFKIEAGSCGISAFSDDSNIRKNLADAMNRAAEKHDRKINPDDYDDE